MGFILSSYLIQGRIDPSRRFRSLGPQEEEDKRQTASHLATLKRTATLITDYNSGGLCTSKKEKGMYKKRK